MLAKLARKLLPEHFHARADKLIPKPAKKVTAKPTKAATKPQPASAAKTATQRKQVSNAD